MTNTEQLTCDCYLQMQPEQDQLSSYSVHCMCSDRFASDQFLRLFESHCHGSNSIHHRRRDALDLDRQSHQYHYCRRRRRRRHPYVHHHRNHDHN
jgi:hypothetical protein